MLVRPSTRRLRAPPYGAENTDRACERAIFYGATDGVARIERTLERGLHTRPLPNHTARSFERTAGFGRALHEYEALLAGGEVFPDAVIASAVLDRLVHHAHLVPILGKSYRMKELKNTRNGGATTRKRNPSVS